MHTSWNGQIKLINNYSYLCFLNDFQVYNSAFFICSQMILYPKAPELVPANWNVDSDFYNRCPTKYENLAYELRTQSCFSKCISKTEVKIWVLRVLTRTDRRKWTFSVWFFKRDQIFVSCLSYPKFFIPKFFINQYGTEEERITLTAFWTLNIWMLLLDFQQYWLFQRSIMYLRAEWQREERKSGKRNCSCTDLLATQWPKDQD